MTSFNGIKNGNNEWLMEIKNGNIGYYSFTDGIDIATGLNWAQQTAALAKQRFETGNTDVYSSLNGSAEQTLTGILSPTVMNDNHRYLTLGSDNNTVGYPFGGYITETFVYQNGALSATDAQKIESYMALKYGVTMNNGGPGAGNYLLSSGTTVWDASAQPAYHNQVIGIVRDDASGLTQKQSHTQDDSLRVFVGSLSADNASNAGAITSNLSSIIIGNNGGKAQAEWGAVKPAGITSIFGRSWKITNTNFADTYSIEIKWDSTGPFDINDIRLLVSTSPDFSSATPIASGTNGITISLGSIIVSGISPSVIPVNSTMYFTIGSANIATTLPIGITAFNATLIGKKVGISWQTAFEASNDYFIVEKSVDQTDWAQVAILKAAGNSSSPKNYSTVDYFPYNGVSYYRLKQINIDGTYSYSETRNIKMDKAKNAFVVIYPNPASGQVTIKGDAAELSTMMIYNMAGQDVTGMVSVTKTTTTTSTQMLLDVSRLSQGVYNIKTTSSINKMIKK